MKKDLILVPEEAVENKIYLIRGVKVMFDFDLALLYQVPTKRLNEAVKRNRNRFPEDFMFRLTIEELENLRSQIATSSSRLQFVILKKYGGRRYMSYAFTEQGVAMLSSVLKSRRAVETSILIVRAFIKLRKMLQSHKDILKEIEEIKRNQNKHDSQIGEIIAVINRFFEQPKEPKKEKIGFRPKK